MFQLSEEERTRNAVVADGRWGLEMNSSARCLRVVVRRCWETDAVVKLIIQRMHTLGSLSRRTFLVRTINMRHFGGVVFFVAVAMMTRRKFSLSKWQACEMTDGK